jgi:hypothetical protein
MSRENLFAYTTPGSFYPSFLSINREENGNVSVTVRSEAKEDGRCGDTAVIELSPQQWNSVRHIT